MSTTEQEAAIRAALAKTYTSRGIELWLKYPRLKWNGHCANKLMGQGRGGEVLCEAEAIGA